MTLTWRHVVVLCLAFLITLPAVTTRLYASDEIEHFAWLRSLTFDADVDFENEYQHFYDNGVAHTPDFHETFLERTTKIGRRINFAPAGAAFLWAPFYVAGHVAALVGGAPADGYSAPYIKAIAYGSACYGFAAVLLSAALARRFAGHGLAASLAIAFGTPLLFYAYIAPGFAHAASAFSVALFLWIWLRVRESWSPAGAVALGLSGALMGSVREQDLFLVAGPALDFASWALAANRMRAASIARPPVTAAAGAASFLVGYTPMLLLYNALNGRPWVTESAERKMNWAAPHAWSVLFDLKHGFFAWTPLALIAATGLILLWLRPAPMSRGARDDLRDTRWMGGLLVLMFAIQAYSSGSVESWTVAGSFGQRRFVALTPILIVGLAVLLARVGAGWPRRIVITAIALSIWWNLGLMAQFGLHRMDRQRLTLAENARQTFVVLPLEAPRLVWRYFFDRSSLYKLPRQ